MAENIYFVYSGMLSAPHASLRCMKVKECIYTHTTLHVILHSVHVSHFAALKLYFTSPNMLHCSVLDVVQIVPTKMSALVWHSYKQKTKLVIGLLDRYMLHSGPNDWELRAATTHFEFGSVALDYRKLKQN